MHQRQVLDDPLLAAQAHVVDDVQDLHRSAPWRHAAGGVSRRPGSGTRSAPPPRSPPATAPRPPRRAAAAPARPCGSRLRRKVEWWTGRTYVRAQRPEHPPCLFGRGVVGDPRVVRADRQDGEIHRPAPAQAVERVGIGGVAREEDRAARLAEQVAALSAMPVGDHPGAPVPGLDRFDLQTADTRRVCPRPARPPAWNRRTRSRLPGLHHDGSSGGAGRAACPGRCGPCGRARGGQVEAAAARACGARAGSAGAAPASRARARGRCGARGPGR